MVRTRYIIEKAVVSDIVIYLPVKVKTYLGVYKTYTRLLKKPDVIFGGFPFVYFTSKQQCKNFIKDL